MGIAALVRAILQSGMYNDNEANGGVSGMYIVVVINNSLSV